MSDRKRLAILITGGNINNRKGLMNACLCRARYLKQCATEYDVDVYILQEEYRDFHLHNIFYDDNCYDTIELDGMNVRVLWKLVYRAKRFYRKALKMYYDRAKTDFLDLGWQHKYACYFKGYDLLSVHSFNGGLIAMEAKRLYDIPYFVTWHGSDIHTHPWERPWVKMPTTAILQKAECNFFVSRALQEKSDRLTTDAHKEVLYNGIDISMFYRFADNTRQRLRERYKIKGDKVVAFVGNLYPIKNADMLPDIFAKVASANVGVLEFWIIGDGLLRTQIEKRLEQLSIVCRMWGDQPVEKMPELYNCIDTLVLPSKNEGLPLVVVEALACGASVVGSRVGGIPEAIGVDNTVELDKTFVDDISMLIISKLSSVERRGSDGNFDWLHTAKIEDEIYTTFLRRR